MLEQLKTDLQNALNEMESKRQSGLDISSNEATVAILRHQIMEAESQQALQVRIEEAKETGYYFDTLTTSNGLTMAELSYSPENHELQAIAVQIGFLAQQDAHNREIEEIEDARLRTVVQALEKLNERDEWIQKCKQAEIERDDSYKKLENAARIMNEQAEEIRKLKEQTAGEAIHLAPLSAEERETKLLAELNGNRTKVTNIRLKDVNGFDTRISLANNALTGEEIEFHTIYIKRYEEISEEAAEQLRADYAAKKAELELQNTVIPTIEPDVEPVDKVGLEEEAPPQENTFQEEVQTSDNGADTAAVRDTTLESMVAKESEINVTIDDSLPIAFTMGTARHIDHLGNIVSTLLDRVSELEAKAAA